MLPYFILAVLGLTFNPQGTHTKKPKPTAKKVQPPTTPPKGLDVLREAPCVLALKGSLIRKFAMPKPLKLGVPGQNSSQKAGEPPMTNQISESFDYELPGTLEEQVDPNGTVHFRFSPDADLAKAGARFALRLQDNLPDSVSGAGSMPVVVDGIEITSVEPFEFEAAGRGQGIAPVAGHVNLRGRLQGTLTPGSPMSQESTVRPVVSNPLPPVPLSLVRSGASALRFQGISLWAWQNSSGPFTVAATMDYQGHSSAGSATGTVTGSVGVTFRVGATKQTTVQK